VLAAPADGGETEQHGLGFEVLCWFGSELELQSRDRSVIVDLST
jgi:hypothetical protein